MQAEPVTSGRVKSESRMSKSGMPPNELKMMVASSKSALYSYYTARCLQSGRVA